MAREKKDKKEKKVPLSAVEQAERDAKLQCRYYEQEYPEVEECVMVQVNNIADMGAYVSLLEYNNIEGMILLSELSRRRIRSINKLIRVGKTEIAMVMRVDKEKGYIDLSRRRVTPEELIKCEERYSKAKAVNSIMRHVARKTDTALLELNQNITWPLARNESFKSAHDAFKIAASGLNGEEGEEIFSEKYEVKASDEIVKILKKVISDKLKPQPVKVRADVEVTCFSEKGIDGIKEALLSVNEEKTEEEKVEVSLIASPLYVFLANALDRAEGLKRVEEGIEKAKKKLEEVGGNLVVKEKPRITNSVDDNQLKNLMEQMEQEKGIEE
eukprot:snap_masked-scaffold_8-processed-gene-12.28-mRNA-1 protein AED:0.02 eAED:0.02 QI:0/-1/0/1/-1/1/1/0/327